MSMALERSRDAMPAVSLRAEQLLLSAMLVSDAGVRDAITLQLRAADFHDPWHAWLFALLRTTRRATVDDIYHAIKANHATDPAPIGDRHAIHELAMLLVDRDAASRCGIVAKLARYAGDVKAGSMLRSKQADMEAKLLALLTEIDSYVRESHV